MWIARDMDGTLKLFEVIPKRFHDGPEIDMDKMGFNDAITVGKDEYSFWAVQKYYKSNEIASDAHGMHLYKSGESLGVFVPYGNEIFKELTWEHEPVEVEIVPRKKGEIIDERSIKERANFCAVNLYLNPETYDEQRAEAYEKGYLHGANDQRFIDIEKAYKLFSEKIDVYNIEHDSDFSFDYDVFRETMLKDKNDK